MEPGHSIQIISFLSGKDTSVDNVNNGKTALFKTEAHNIQYALFVWYLDGAGALYN